jgi:hypothetical protein
MQTKLTLRLDAALIRRAKAYAEARGKSVSQVVADFFTALEPGEQAEASAAAELPPITRSLYGRLAGADVDEEAYHRHLEEKHR